MRKQWNSVQRFSLRKFSIGLASVLLATMFMSQGVMAQTNEVSENPKNTKEVVKPDDTAVSTVQPKATEKVEETANVSTDNKLVSGNVIESKDDKELPKEESENKISKEEIDTKELNDLISVVEAENKNNLPTTFKNEITEEINKAKLVLKDAKTQAEINKEITVLEGLKTRIEAANKPKRRSRRAETELQDVKIGLVKKGNISDDIIRVAPRGLNYAGGVLQVKAESLSDNITDVTVDGAHGFMTHRVEGINTKTVKVSFVGDTPRGGNFAITVTVKTKKGSKSFTFGHYATLPKPTIETSDEDLKGKANQKPTVKIKSNTTPPSSFVGGAKLRVYLIRNGADLSAYGLASQGAYPEGYTILASKDVDASGNAEITESDYIVEKIGEGKIKAITVIELPNKKNDTNVGERGSFISDERTVTAPLVAPVVDKNGAINEINAEAGKKNKEIDDANLLPADKTKLKQEVEQAKTKGITEVNNATSTQDVTTKKDTAISTIRNISLDEAKRNKATKELKALLAKKSEAKMLIEQEAMKKKAEISQAELSESEKALLDARVDQEKAKAFQMIDQATTIEEVNQALKEGIEAIRSIAVASANGRMTDITSEESEEAMAQVHRQALPQTGTGNEVAIFGAAASAILAGLGLVVPSKKKED